ncbi:hypothetical protein OG806_49525 [Streptomyces sp. NBC_00882]|uniref:hypothetical protein n=1 Tax=Streptomyces sp. NBC_00882 TaxID=2975856 RepID=UPI003863AFDE|nr:hypothetical protein OG806_00425 [Streptomyces sp. NBC_00882]WSZ36858.1 hypothetical protein OG806_49525 [Streptomyces sp. NBC_00882]
MTEPSNRPPDDDEPLTDPVTLDGPALHLHLASPTAWSAYRAGLQVAADRIESLPDSPPDISL